MYSLFTNNKKLELKVGSQTISFLPDFKSSSKNIHLHFLIFTPGSICSSSSCPTWGVPSSSFPLPYFLSLSFPVSSFCSFVLFLFSSSFLPSLFPPSLSLPLFSSVPSFLAFITTFKSASCCLNARFHCLAQGIALSKFLLFCNHL